MSRDIIFTRGINRSKNFSELVKKYAFDSDSNTSKNKKIFKTIKDMMFFVALLGFSENKRIPFEDGEQKEDIASNTWINEKNIGLIFAIGLSEKQDSSILKLENEDELLKIFEEFSNGGFHILKEWDMVSDMVGLDSIISGLMNNNYFSVLGQEKNENLDDFDGFEK